MSKSRSLVWVLAVAAVVLWIGGGIAMAAGESPVKIGVVDLARIDKDAPRMKQYASEIAALQKSLETKLEIRYQNMLLSANEVEELVNLKTKEGTLTDADKAKIKQLEDAQAKRADELQKLEQNTQQTEAEKARMNELHAAKKASDDSMQAFAKTYQETFTGKVSELQKAAESDVKDAISKVAQAKGMTVVVAKEAVLFGGTDITNDVIDKLIPKS